MRAEPASEPPTHPLPQHNEVRRVLSSPSTVRSSRMRRSPEVSPRREPEPEGRCGRGEGSRSEVERRCSSYTDGIAHPGGRSTEDGRVGGQLRSATPTKDG